MIFEKCISNKEINVCSEDWADILSSYSQEEIISDLTREILAGNIRLPIRLIEYDEMKDSFHQLCDYKSNGMLYSENVYTRYEYKYPLSGRYIDESNIGNTASDYFHQLNRFYTDSINEPSPYRVWNSDKFLHSALGALFTLKPTQLNMQTLRNCLHLRKYVASQFKPTVAKTIYELFDSRDVLDFSSGWGDRLCGFFAAEKTCSYVGIDPNTRLHDGYVAQLRRYPAMAKNEKYAKLICRPAEDIHLNKDSFDTVFTSPPYFNIEKYCQEETQSFKRYRKFDNWLENFLFKAIDNA